MKLTPSIEKSLYRLLAPITEISTFLEEPVLIETLGSNLAKSPTDLLIVGTPSIAVLSKSVPVPIFIEPAFEATVTTSSRSSAEASVIDTLVVSLRIRYKPSTVSDE